MPLYEFVCDCGAAVEKLMSADLRPRRIDCPANCGGDAEYRVGMPAHFRIAIEGGGRRGYKMDMGNGRKTVRSATRERWEHQAGNQQRKDFNADPRAASASQYTREYQRKLDEEKKTKQAAVVHAAKNAEKGGS